MTLLDIPTTNIWHTARTLLRQLFGDDHTGATTDWHPLAELPPAGELDPQVEHAHTGEVLRTITDELGRWVPDLYDLEPARIFDAVLYGTDAGQPFRAAGVNAVNGGGRL